MLGGIDMWANQIFGLSLFGTMSTKGPDFAQLLPAAKAKPISYGKPDGVITFRHFVVGVFSGTRHDEDEPVHLKLKEPTLPIREKFARLCGSRRSDIARRALFEVVASGANELQFVINAANCVHCKTCDIKDPAQNITWVPPEGGDGAGIRCQVTAQQIRAMILTVERKATIVKRKKRIGIGVEFGRAIAGRVRHTQDDGGDGRAPGKVRWRAGISRRIFAAAAGDVKGAASFYADTLKDDPANADLLSRAFLYAAESGDIEHALALSDRVIAQDSAKSSGASGAARRAPW